MRRSLLAFAISNLLSCEFKQPMAFVPSAGSRNRPDKTPHRHSGVAAARRAAKKSRKARR